MTLPNRPKIYHITHLDNLPGIIQRDGLISDSGRITSELDCYIVGMSAIKQRRLEDINVTCHSGTKVGEYVPFYFCARSIMLYILHMGNHPDIIYQGGQQPIVHLQADLHTTVQWAQQHNNKWAFSDRNAGSYLADFYNKISELGEINWSAVASMDFRDMQVKEGKQAEFLFYEFFPWSLIEKIGVFDAATAASVQSIVCSAEHNPPVTVEETWYY